MSDPVDQRLAIARLVADHWRAWAMRQPDAMTMPTRIAAHPLCCVLAALDGETDPDRLGIEPNTVTAALIRDEVSTASCETRPNGALNA